MVPPNAASSSFWCGADRLDQRRIAVRRAFIDLILLQRAIENARPHFAERVSTPRIAISVK
jgi:hypothetical protein